MWKNIVCILWSFFFKTRGSISIRDEDMLMQMLDLTFDGKSLSHIISNHFYCTKGAMMLEFYNMMSRHFYSTKGEMVLTFCYMVNRHSCYIQIQWCWIFGPICMGNANIYSFGWRFTSFTFLVGLKDPICLFY